MKRFMTSILLIFTVLFGTCVPVLAEGDIRVVLDGRELAFEQPPVIVNDRTMVPMRAIFEALGATVTWDGVTRTVYSRLGKINISLTVGKKELIKNGTVISLDIPAQIINDRTLVPVRAISESFECDVNWDAKSRIVSITTVPPAPEKATISLESGMIYEGEAADGKPNGYGMIYDKGKKPVFEGTFLNGLPNGVCINYLSDGYFFLAPYVNGKLDVESSDGVKLDSDKNPVYVGGFDENFVPNGKGREIDPSTQRVVYEGVFKDGKYHEAGTYYSASGLKYDGEFNEGWFSGEGWLYNSQDVILRNIRYDQYLKDIRKSLKDVQKRGLDGELLEMKNWAFEKDVDELKEWRTDALDRENTKTSAKEEYDPYESSWGQDIFREYGVLEVYKKYKKLDPYTRTGGIMNPAVAQQKSALEKELRPAMNEINRIYREKQGANSEGSSDSTERLYEKKLNELKVKYEITD